MGLYENIARLKEANLCNIVLVPSRLSASGRNKLHYYHHHPILEEADKRHLKAEKLLREIYSVALFSNKYKRNIYSS
jgi:hypothetical protein